MTARTPEDELRCDDWVCALVASSRMCTTRISRIQVLGSGLMANCL
jgi:hypothetical protein